MLFFFLKSLALTGVGRARLMPRCIQPPDPSFADASSCELLIPLYLGETNYVRSSIRLGESLRSSETAILRCMWEGFIDGTSVIGLRP